MWMTLSMAARTVHPRVGGEHTLPTGVISRYIGSSPRGRGTPGPGQSAPSPTRFIPAWAGNTADCRIARLCPSVHPRVGGEHETGISHLPPKNGSSPRGRGTLRMCFRYRAAARFIPAWAGNTTLIAPTIAFPAVHPRVGGEHVTRALETIAGTGSSPRGRGTHEEMQQRGIGPRFIPAWAGNTAAAIIARHQASVHPRVGGEHVPLHFLRSWTSGSSPRGRGTLH